VEISSLKKEIGLQLWSVRDSMKADPKGTMKAISQMGYSFVETALPEYVSGRFYGMEPATFRTLVESNNMVLLISHAGRWLSDSVSWKETMDWWDSCIAVHKAAGVKYIVQPNMQEDAYSSLAILRKYCEYFNAVGEKCNKNDIRFGFHNHDREFSQIDSVTIYDFLLNNTDPSKVMFQLDVYGAKEGGKSAVDYIHNYPGRFELWHLKDRKELGPNGTIDLKALFELSKKAGMIHFAVDLEAHDLPRLESVRKCFEFLNDAEYVKQPEL
jgi:sugar phosphate isomerase/epimerase